MAKIMIMDKDTGEVVEVQNGSLLVTLDGANGVIPTNLMYHEQQTIQTHNAVSVATGAWSDQTSWMDCDGFTEIALTLKNDASTSCRGQIMWSNDGTNQHGVEEPILSAAGMFRAGGTSIKARYAKVTIQNGDTAAHTMSAWAFLKA